MLIGSSVKTHFFLPLCLPSLILQPCLGKPEPGVKFLFLLSLHWLTLSMSLSNSLITEAWVSSSDNWEYWTSSLCYLLVCYQILWLNWACLSYLFSLLSIFLILIKIGCSIQGFKKKWTIIIPISNLLGFLFCFTQIVLNKVTGEECFVIYILKMYMCVDAYWHICSYTTMNADAHEHICMYIWTPKVELGSSVTFHLTHWGMPPQWNLELAH